MPAFLIRPDLELDLYVWWSTVTDSPVMWLVDVEPYES